MENSRLIKYASSFKYTGYIVSLFFVGITTLIKFALFDIEIAETPFLLYFLPIIFIARYYGIKEVIFTACIASLVIVYFFIPPFYSFSIDARYALQVLIFLFECFLIICLSNHSKKIAKREIDHLKTFKLLVEKSCNGFLMVQLDGGIVYRNPAVKKISGYDANDLEGSKLWSFFLQEEITAVKEKFYSLASHSGQTIKLIHRVRHREGHIIWIENTITNLIEEPLVKSIIFSFTDVTERVVREQQMEDFIGIASHELKTPLTSLKAYTQVLEMRMKKENNLTSSILVSKIDKQINRVISMIFDLLDVTKLQTGIMHLNNARFEINELITDVVESMQNTSKTHEIKTDLSAAIIVNADKTRISQVLTNLISNGIKYSPDADSIRVYTTLDNGFIKVWVSDSGIGISKTEIDKIFNRFYRVSSIKESYQGLGLGLYISMQIIERHGGKMGVISEANKGSTFWFSLPL